EPEGMVCLYGMLSALFVHHLYLRGNVEQPEPEEDDKEVFRLSTDLARLMIVNKNNCLDFFDSSNWPLTLAQLVATLKPTEVDKTLRLEIQPERKFVPWLLPNFGSAAAALAKSSDVHGTSLVAYITGTHAALAREPAEMLTRFASSLLGIGMAAVMEVADDTHCGFLGCHPAENREEVEPLLPSLGLREMMGVGFQPVGLRELGQKHFRPRWTALDIIDLPGLLSEFQERFRQHSLSRAVDIAVCTSPAVLCLLLLPFNRPLLAYLGEPLLLSVDESGRDKWFEQFDSLATDPHHFFTCYNPFLSSMIEYQTGLILPTIRLHGLYTEVSYTPSGRRGEEVLVIKGPNICTDSVCVLNKFLSNLLGQSSAGGTAEDGGNYKLKFVGLDELGGASYEEMASFKATVLYPYDVALAIFYELYSMGMPLLLPHERLLPFFVFRGLHSAAEYHAVRAKPDGSGNYPGAGLGCPPFVPPMEPEKWFYAGSQWSWRTDFAKFPFILRFGSVAELLSFFTPEGADWWATSRSMRRFNQETLTQSAASWAYGVAAVLAGRGGAERAATSS
ncbi:unnamed protein product, partial [Symbiodinium sp. CCMP2456]